eukprot:CAMPEP_0184478236 /NCGR_PEP_ID=MMETSP0113_2-20130426/310_1 /TAXON_ID=91329 /ORGANISM="Norrisiella sphaerica, Strain BC52" /LENGTH=173 /DNA_ID=CAMNT_0026855941 /DNA_START=28 /DNA_END=549 /DNA_ORIENTATION=+
MSPLASSLALNAVLAVVAVVMLVSQSGHSSVLTAAPAASIHMSGIRAAGRSMSPLRYGVCRSASGAAARRGVSVNGQAYKVTLKTPTGEHEIECPDDMYILDKAEQLGISLPFSCRAGFCISCAGIIEEGGVDQSDQTFLNEKQLNDGIVLTCFAKPTSDVVVRTHVENELSL